MTNANGRTHVYVGAARMTAGSRGGLFRKASDDDRWEPLASGLPEQTNVQAITLHPADPDVLYIGTHRGPYRSTDRGETWERPEFPDDGTQVWSIMVHPTDARVLYAGTSPIGVFRSDDGGDTWRRLPKAVQPDRVKMDFACRVMRLAADPAQPGHVYAALEVGGVMRTMDGGETWDDCTDGLLKLAELPHLKSRIQSDTDAEGMLDGHAIVVSAARPGSVIVAVRMGLFRSDDGGKHWEDMRVGRFSPLTYARDIRVAPHDPRVLYACLSPAARSEDGSLYRSDDVGETWTRVDRGVKAERTMMAVAVHGYDAKQVYCVSRCGQVFGTRDGGTSWTESRLPPDVQDVYAIACGSDGSGGSAPAAS